MTLAIDIENARRCIGRRQISDDIGSLSAQLRLARLLDYEQLPWPESELAPLGHWLNFLPDARQANLADDGHPKRGGFLPQIPLPRRMWAAGALEFKFPIPVGQPIRRRSTITDVAARTGSTGDLVFVTIEHEIFVETRTALFEEQTIVYRGQSQSSKQPVPKGDTPAGFARSLILTETALFRYSALTYNAHRIHYDQAYATTVEGYPALVAQGPFIATLLLDHFSRRHPLSRIRRFSFRAEHPIFVGQRVELGLRGDRQRAEAWASTQDARCMSAKIEAD